MLKKTLDGTITVCITCVIIYYFWFVFRYSANVPVGDDFEVFLHFWLQYKQAPTVGEKLRLLFAQFVEHRLAYTRFVFLLMAEFNLVDFRFILLVGNLSLVALFLLIRHLLCITFRLPIYCLLPPALLIFQPCYSFDGSLWPAATLAYFPVAVGAVLTIYLLTLRTPNAFQNSLLAALFTTFSFGNGQFVWPIGMALLFLQRRHQQLAVWSATMGFALIGYYLNYQINPSRPDVFQNLTRFPFYIFLNVLTFLGGLTERTEGYVQPLTWANLPALVAGTGVLMLFGFVMLLYTNTRWQPARLHNLTRYSRVVFSQEPRMGLFWLGTLGFFVLSGVVFSIARTDATALFSHVNRYRIHSVCAIVLCYCFVAVYVRQRPQWATLSATVSLLFAVLSYHHFAYHFAENARTYRAGAYNWYHQKQWGIYYETYYWESAAKIISDQFEAQALNLYQFPVDLFSAADTTQVCVSIQLNHTNSHSIVQNTSLPANYSSPTDGVYVLLQSTHATRLLAAHLKPHSVFRWLRTGQYYGSGFHLAINKLKMLPGTYQIDLIHRQHDRNTRYKTGSVLTIAAPEQTHSQNKTLIRSVGGGR
jgi:hypothetical protein